MKIFTHSLTIIIFENGEFCWKNKGLRKRSADENKNFMITLLFCVPMWLIILQA